MQKKKNRLILLKKYIWFEILHRTSVQVPALL